MIATGGFRTPVNITTRVYEDDGTPLWTADHGASVYCVTIDSEGNVYTGGNVTGGVTTRKYDINGDVVWSINHGNSVNAIAVDNQGNVYTGGNVTSNLTTRKYDSSGGLLWSANHGNTVKGIAVDADGNVYTTGYRATSDYVTRKYDSNGVLLWSIAGLDSYSIAVNSTIVMVGSVYGTGSQTLRTYAFDGTPGSTSNFAGDLRGICGDTSGNIYAATANYFGSTNYKLIRYNSSLSLTKQLLYINDVAFCVAVDPDGNMYLGSGVISSYSTRKYASDGTLLWSDNHGNAVYGIAHRKLGSKTLMPGLGLPITIGNFLAEIYFSANIPSLAIPISVASPVSSTPPLPPEWASLAVAKIYRAVLSIPGGDDLLDVPLASFQCVRQINASTWLTVVTPVYSPTLKAALTARIGGELLINAGTRNSYGIETLGLFMRATLTAVEYTLKPSGATITLTARVINPSYSSTTRTMSGIRNRSKDNGRWSLVCDADPLLRPNDTATIGPVTFTVGTIRHSVGPNDAMMEVTEEL